jgi:hypothetical protein
MTNEHSSVLAAMKRAGAPLTRDEYIRWNWFDQPHPYEPTWEEEAEMPEMFSRYALDNLISDKLQ